MADMALQKSTIVWDDQRDTTVHLGMTNHDGSDAAYLRKCVEFYEMNKAGATGMQQILERLTRLEQMLKRGVVVGGQSDASSDTDDIFDDLLEQIE